MAWFDLSLVPDPAVWLAERLGGIAWVWMEATAAPTPPDVTAKVEAVPEVPGGYGELLSFFPNMKPSSVRRGPRPADDPRNGAKRDRVPLRSDPRHDATSYGGRP